MYLICTLVQPAIHSGSPPPMSPATILHNHMENALVHEDVCVCVCVGGWVWVCTLINV